MNKNLSASVVLLTFVFVAGLGLLTPLIGHAEHSGCPFALSEPAICASPFSHVEDWQDATLTIIIELLLAVSTAFIFGRSFSLFSKADLQYVRYRLRARVPIRPSLFQELYSQGILNRKAP